VSLRPLVIQAQQKAAKNPFAKKLRGRRHTPSRAQTRGAGPCPGSTSLWCSVAAISGSWPASSRTRPSAC
jgi:hypothetical protein